MSSLRTRSMTRTLADTVAERRVGDARRRSRTGTAAASCSRTWWCWASSSASRCCFASRRRCSSCSSGVSLGMAVKPGVEWLRRRGIPRWAGALAIYAALGCLCAGVLTLAVPVVAEQTATLVARAPHHFERLRTELLSSESNTLRRIAWYLPAAVERSGDARARRQVRARHRRRRRAQPVHDRRRAAARVLLDAGGRAPRCARWCCSRRSIAAGRSAASSPRSSAPSAPICAGSRWSAWSSACSRSSSIA